MIWLALALAIIGGALMATTYVTDALPSALVDFGLLMWVLSFMIFIAFAVMEARTSGKTLRQTLGAAGRTTWEFLRDLTP